MSLNKGRGWWVAQMALVPALALTLVGLVAAANPQKSRPQWSSPVMTALQAVPNGQATMSWDPVTQNLWVTITMSGLDPNTTHIAHIHQGDCAHDRGIVYPLEPISADGDGNAIQTTLIANVSNGIPASGWYINVHMGPNASSAANLVPIACGAISNPGASTDWPQDLTVNLNSAFHVSGMVMMQTYQGNLYVHMHADGLVPFSRHSAHIHMGSCFLQGDVLYPLTTLVADSHGHAMAMTVIHGVGSIDPGWYVNLHYGDLGAANHTMADHAPIACGDVSP